MARSYMSDLSNYYIYRGNGQTSKPGAPLPITLFKPATISPVEPGVCSMLEGHAAVPVQSSTCEEYAATVCRSGDVRSMSRSGGVVAQAHVGEGQAGVRGIWRRGSVVEKARRENVRGTIRGRIHGKSMRERRVNVEDMVRVVLLVAGGKSGQMCRCSEWRSAGWMTRLRI
jgi:hypothetical protein